MWGVFHCLRSSSSSPHPHTAPHLTHVQLSNQFWSMPNVTLRSTKISATFSMEPLLLSTSSFLVWAAPSTTLTLWSSRNWVLMLKEIRSLPPSSMCTLLTSLLNLPIPDVPFPVLLSTLTLERLWVSGSQHAQQQTGHLSFLVCHPFS